MTYIFDPLRKKNVKLTPEERVRQNLIVVLNEQCGYPLSHMASEYSFSFNSLTYRADIVVFNRQLKPKILVECKAPSVVLSEDVIDQVIRYNYVLKVEYILISNGSNSLLLKKDNLTGVYSPSRNFPTFEQLQDD